MRGEYVGIIRKIARKHGLSIERVYHLIWNLENEGKLRLRRRGRKLVIRTDDLKIIEKELEARKRKGGGTHARKSESPRTQPRA